MKRLIGLGVGLVAAAVLVVTAMAAGTVTVTPANLNGWQIIPDGTVANGFVAGPASMGVGSLQFGPISGLNPANKFILRAPYNGLVSNLTSFSYDFYIDPASLGNHNHFYVNVYVDSAANGIGTLATFYDCRYDSVPAGGVFGAWNTHGFTQTSAWNNVASPLAGCPATLAGLPAGSKVLAIILNGGQSNASDAGLMGGFDKIVETTISNGATVYDFEPYDVATDKDECKNGGWQNVKRADGSSFKNQGDCVSYTNTGR